MNLFNLAPPLPLVIQEGGGICWTLNTNTAKEGGEVTIPGGLLPKKDKCGTK